MSFADSLSGDTILCLAVTKRRYNTIAKTSTELEENSVGMGKMNKWIIIPIIGVLVAGLIAIGFLYLQETNKLKDAQSEIVTLEGNVSTLEARMSPKLNLSPLRLMD